MATLKTKLTMPGGDGGGGEDGGGEGGGREGGGGDGGGDGEPGAKRTPSPWGADEAIQAATA